MIQNGPQNDPQITYFCLLFASWALPGGSWSVFRRSQSAPGAFRDPPEIIKELKNQVFDALGRSWGALGALLGALGAILTHLGPKMAPK